MKKIITKYIPYFFEVNKYSDVSLSVLAIFVKILCFFEHKIINEDFID